MVWCGGELQGVDRRFAYVGHGAEASTGSRVVEIQADPRSAFHWVLQTHVSQTFLQNTKAKRH